MDCEALAEAVRNHDRRSLARAITLIESTRADHRAAASELLARLMPYTGDSIRIGISGAPGVGKSTFIEALGNHVIEQGRRLAVLAVDPSSAISGGSILGDKTRMALLARRRHAFIRPSPAGRTLGGVARRTRESILLSEAAGFDVIIVETVGVGQSETAVADMTDMFVLLLLPGSGDELQGIKRGNLELADLVLVNKADGDMAAAARRTAADFGHAMRLLTPRSRKWRVPVETCSALQGEGIAEVWETVQRHRDTLSRDDEFTARRANQALAWLWTEISESLLLRFKQHPVVERRLRELEDRVIRGSVAPSVAADELIGTFLQGEPEA